MTELKRIMLFWIFKGGRSPVVPNSVHKLRPGDIDLIGSLGDSLTAGFGIFATKIVELLTENRGVSATGGGQGSWREYLTIPNILKVWQSILPVKIYIPLLL